MKEKDLPIDRAQHAVYTKKAKKCVLRLLRRNYDERTCEQLWEKIQLQYCEFLKDEPPMAGAKIKVSMPECGNCWKKRKRTATRATMRTWRRF